MGTIYHYFFPNYVKYGFKFCHPSSKFQNSCQYFSDSKYNIPVFCLMDQLSKILVLLGDS